MYGLLWQKRVRPWFARRWYRPLTGLVAPCAIAIPASGLLLALIPHAEHPLRLSPLAGLVGAIAFSFVQFAIAMIVVMRCPQVLRVAMVLSIVTLTTVFTWYVPTEDRVQLPLIFAVYSGCFGSLLVGTAFRSVFRRSLVGPGGYSLGASSKRSDIVLLVVMMLFFWIQYDELYTRRMSASFGFGFLWACAAAGAATSWSFLALSHFKNRLSAYVIAMPIVIVAAVEVSNGVHEYMYAPLPWIVIAIVVVAALVGWILAQELGSRLLVLSHWKWRALKRVGKLTISGMPPDSLHPPTWRSNITLLQNSWWCLASLFLAPLFCSILISFAESWITFRLRSYCYGILLSITVASATSFCVLAAHQIQRLWAQCLTLAVFLLVLVSMIPEAMKDSPSLFRYGILAFPIPIATVVYMLIRLADQQTRHTIGVIKRVREPISIQELMGGTLIMGIEFSMLRLAQIEILPLVTALCAALFLCLISLVIYRAYFIGFNRGTWVASGLLFAIILAFMSFNRELISEEPMIALGLFLTCHLIIARSLFRFGWTSIPV
jgi:hypothetical protein